jgi:hypothetical protein
MNNFNRAIPLVTLFHFIILFVCEIQYKQFLTCQSNLDFLFNKSNLNNPELYNNPNLVMKVEFNFSLHVKLYILSYTMPVTSKILLKVVRHNINYFSHPTRPVAKIY